MKALLTSSAFVLAGLACASAHALAEAPVTQLLVKPSQFHAAHARELGPAALAPFVQAAGVPLEHVRSLGMQIQVLRLPQPMSLGEAHAFAARLVEDGVALVAEPDRRVYPSLVPNDPRYEDQWHYHAVNSGNYGINLPGAWEVTTGGSSVVVALIDTGIRPHVDLDQGILDTSGRVIPGYDFIADVPTANDGDGRDADPSDPGDWVTEAESRTAAFDGCGVQESSWHGTHLAGTLAAASSNGMGVAAIDWNARLQPVRVLGKCGGYSSDVIDGLRWAAGLSVPGVPANLTPARVLNMSFNGLGTCSAVPGLQEAVDAVRSSQAVLMVAAGNEGANADAYFPGNCAGVINVTATTLQGQRASYSNTGDTVVLAAPGGASPNGILSTSNDGTTDPGNDTYAEMIGTSMATAHVSGVVSLMLSVNPALSPNDVRTILQDTATAFPSEGGCTTSTCGAGIVNAEAAVRAAVGYTAPPAPRQTDGSSSEGGGGGGSLGLLPLAGLAGLALLRRRQRLAQ